MSLPDSSQGLLSAEKPPAHLALGLFVFESKSTLRRYMPDMDTFSCIRPACSVTLSASRHRRYVPQMLKNITTEHVWLPLPLFRSRLKTGHAAQP